MRGSFERRSSGFTLIELALVLLILGILATLAAPSLSWLGAAHLDTDARRLAATISYLHDEAALRGRVYRLTLDLDASRYDIAVGREDTGEFVSPRSAEGWDPYASESRVLADGIRFASLQTASAATTTGTTSVYFLPEDARESFKLVLQASSGDARTLDADGVTGRVAIVTGDGTR
jgi:general secretion pathway protein H